MNNLKKYIIEKLVIGDNLYNTQYELSEKETKYVEDLMYIFATNEWTHNFLKKIYEYKNNPEQIPDNYWIDLINVFVGCIYFPSYIELKKRKTTLSKEANNWIENEFKKDWDDIINIKYNAILYKKNVSEQMILDKSKKYRIGMLNGIIKAYKMFKK